MKYLSVILIFTLVGCSNIHTKEEITAEFKNDNILIAYNGNKEYFKIPYATTDTMAGIKPALCIDSINNTIYIYVPSFGIEKYNLSNKKLIKEAYLEYIYRKMNHSYSLQIINDYLILSSYLQILVYDKNLEMRANLRQTIETDLCPEYALHYFNTEFIGDTILFKALFVEIGDFEANRRHKRIYKDYEFILRPDKVICNNCDTCNNKNVLTKQEMDELLKNPL
jgi:hypothetical protein